MTRNERRAKVYDLATEGKLEEAERIADNAPSQTQRDALRALIRSRIRAANPTPPKHRPPSQRIARVDRSHVPTAGEMDIARHLVILGLHPDAVAAVVLPRK